MQRLPDTSESVEEKFTFWAVSRDKLMKMSTDKVSPLTQGKQKIFKKENIMIGSAVYKIYKITIA